MNPSSLVLTGYIMYYVSIEIKERIFIKERYKRSNRNTSRGQHFYFMVFISERILGLSIPLSHSPTLSRSASRNAELVHDACILHIP